MRNAQTIAAAIGFLILIMDSKTAIHGGMEGIRLCVLTIIPALFPFLFLSNLLFAGMNRDGIPALRPISRMLDIPEGGEFLLIPAFLGGYPAGAQTVAQLYAAGVVTKEHAQRLLAFTNNAGPAFIFGIAALAFPHSGYGWLLWGIHIAAAITAGLFTARNEIIHVKSVRLNHSQASPIEKSTKTMAVICAWVVLMRVLIAFLDRWLLFMLPEIWRTCIYGLLELSIGCTNLKVIPNDHLRLLICSALLSLGGGCVALQTLSVTKGLSLKHYYIGKAVQTITAIFLCCLVWMKKAFILLWIPVCLSLIFVKQRNKCSNSEYIRV